MTGRHPVGVVLTGGASTRMGVDKATLVIGDKPMAVRVADVMWEAGCQPVECQGGDVATITEYGLVAVPDRDPGSGPVAAIRDALDRHEGSDVVVVACDLVDVDAATIAAVSDAGAGGDADVAVAASDGQRHLISWWSAGVGPRLDELVGAGVTSYREALSELKAVDVAVDPTVVRNVNTPTDLGDPG
jgi:molybdopterin-guanine dinucleotide biosynthesis protein A